MGGWAYQGCCRMEIAGQWVRVWRKTEASNGELRPNVQRIGGVSVLGGWLNGLSIGPGPNGSFQFQAAVERASRRQVAQELDRVRQGRKDEEDDKAEGRRQKAESLGLQLKAEKVIYFVLRFLTTFSTLYNSNDSRKLQPLPSSFELSPWLYKFSPALCALPTHPSSTIHAISLALFVPVPLSAR